MRQHSLLAKKNKYSLRVSKVEYLGNFMFREGASTDPSKVKTQEWLVPKNVKELRSFLGLADYYRKFVKRLCSY